MRIFSRPTRDPLAKRVRAIVAARREAITWRRTYRADTPDAYWSYLRRYPRGPHAADARRRLAILPRRWSHRRQFAVIDYDVPPPPPDEIVYVDRPVLDVQRSGFRFRAAATAAGLLSAAAATGFRGAGAAATADRPVLPAAAVVRADPGLCQPPVYVAPPPNNIIYTNIHNTTVINNVINQPPPPAAPAPAPGGPNVQPNARGPASPPVAAAEECPRHCRPQSRNGRL